MKTSFFKKVPRAWSTEAHSYNINCHSPHDQNHRAVRSSWLSPVCAPFHSQSEFSHAHLWELGYSRWNPRWWLLHRHIYCHDHTGVKVNHESQFLEIGVSSPPRANMCSIFSDRDKKKKDSGTTNRQEPCHIFKLENLLPGIIKTEWQRNILMRFVSFSLGWMPLSLR